MNMNLESKEAAAMVVEQLRTFDSLMAVDARTLTESINEMGGSVVNMTAICTYAPYTPLNNEDTSEEEEGTQENTENNSEEENVSEEGTSSQEETQEVDE